MAENPITPNWFKIQAEQQFFPVLCKFHNFLLQKILLEPNSGILIGITLGSKLLLVQDFCVKVKNVGVGFMTERRG